MSFDPVKFERWCQYLRIDTKDFGPRPLRWIGSQRYVVQKIAEGLQHDVHTFVILKGRQLGISTVLLALDLYWMIKHDGLQGAVVTDTDENKTLFRSNVASYLDSLPVNMRRGVREHNRIQLMLDNRSRMNYLTAGLRGNGNLGRGKAVNLLHGTETSSWGDEEGLASLFATLSQQHPDRLFTFESTARGYNMFYQMCETAKSSVGQMFIFVGWWLNEGYRKRAGTEEYRTYWDGSLTTEEREWSAEVFRRYKVSIDDEQLAWWRWYCAENMRGDTTLMMQEFPPTEDYAFQLSGAKFFNGERINQFYRHAIDLSPEYYRWTFGLHFEDTKFTKTEEAMADITIWELPDPRGVYTFGCDPAYGSSEWADQFVISVWRCYADRIVQVAEVCTTEWTQMQYAWVMAHLGGLYRAPVVVLEMLGPGGAVYNELFNLRRMAGTPVVSSDNRDMYNVVGQIRDYFYRRQDSMTGTVALQWQTNSKEKHRIMETMRSYIERNCVVVRSPGLAEEMRNIRRVGDHIGGEGRAKDDRVVAAAMAITAGWNDSVMPEMQAMGRTYAFEHAPRKEGVVKTPLETNVEGFFRRQGLPVPWAGSDKQ